MSGERWGDSGQMEGGQQEQKVETVLVELAGTLGRPNGNSAKFGWRSPQETQAQHRWRLAFDPTPSPSLCVASDALAHSNTLLLMEYQPVQYLGLQVQDNIH